MVFIVSLIYIFRNSIHLARDSGFVWSNQISGPGRDRLIVWYWSQLKKKNLKDLEKCINVVRNIELRTNPLLDL